MSGTLCLAKSLYESTHVKCQKRQVYDDRTHRNVCLELDMGAETGCKWAQGNILVWGDGNVSEMFLNWIVVMTAQLYKFTENH